MNTFTTDRFHLAIYLHATGKLDFLKCQQSRPGRQAFVFADPDHISAEIELSFDNGALVSTSSLFASQNYLRKVMTLTSNRNKGYVIGKLEDTVTTASTHQTCH